MGSSDIAPEKNVAKKSSAIVQTMSGVVKTKRRPERERVPRRLAAVAEPGAVPARPHA